MKINKIQNDKIRLPESAGIFYSNDKNELNSQIDDFFNSVDDSIIDSSIMKIQELKAIICPHAGYIYSGKTAMYSYKLFYKYLLNLLKTPTKNNFDKMDFAKKEYIILMLSPIHTFYQENICVLDVDSYSTPLGNVIADRAQISALLNMNDSYFRLIDLDLGEHSLEVQLPFLQYIFSKLNLQFKIIPLYVGPFDIDHNLSYLINIINNLNYDFILVSTDLSHYNSEDIAKIKDKKSLVHIMNNTFELKQKNINLISACGIYPLILLKQLSKTNYWKSQLLNYSNSSDISKDKQRVVGYGAVAFYI